MPVPRPLLLLALVSGISTTSMPAMAQALDDQPGGVVGLSLAGARVLSVRSAAALWANPANLVHSKDQVLVGLRLQTGDCSLQRTDIINASAISSARDTAGVQVLPVAGLALPIWKRRLWIAVGYHPGIQAESFYPPSSGPTSRTDPARYSGTELSLQHHRASLGLAFGWSFISVGATLDLGHLRIRHRRSHWAGLAADSSKLINPDGRLDLDATLEGNDVLDAGALLGIWIEPLSFLQAGLTVRLPVTTKVQGTAALASGSDTHLGYNAWATQDGEMSLDLILPLEIRGGLAFTWGRVRIFGEGALTRWASMDDPQAQLTGATIYLEKSGSSGPTTESRPISGLSLGLRLRDRFSFHAGVEVRLFSGFMVLRSGYAYHHGATMPEAPNPLLLDLNRHVWAGGIEVKVQRVSLGMGFHHSFQATLNSSGEGTTLSAPLAPQLSQPVGEGRYTSQMTRILLEARVSLPPFE